MQGDLPPQEASNRRLKAEISALRYGLVSAWKSVGLLPYNEQTGQLIDNIRADMEAIFEDVGMKIKE